MSKFTVLSVLFFTSGLLLTALLPLQAYSSTSEHSAESPPPEVGAVTWRRDFHAALKESSRTGKPIFLFFQEVPGCSGCKKFGTEVLGNTLLKEAIESLFIPVLVFNNRDGVDAEILERYNEPSWNYQVIRFIDGDGKDIIPRKDRVWDLQSLALRMMYTLETLKAPVPVYLRALTVSRASSDIESIIFSMYCFWTGEAKFGALPGVIETEAGFLDGREVTKVWYQKGDGVRQSLMVHADHAQCADAVYLRGSESPPSSFRPQRLKFRNAAYSEYRPAPASDQKKQLEGTALSFLRQGNSYQATKANAFIRRDINVVRAILSPSQRAKLKR